MRTDQSSSAIIALNLGGSIQGLSINGKHIIAGLELLDYNTSYASAVLFPFANRIKNGKYIFKDKQYVLDLNVKKENNALHGLIYNKTFTYIKEEISLNHASVTIGYEETKKVKGFPFKYAIHLTYTLSANALELSVAVVNNDQTPFPFTIGWHPYFLSSDLHESFLTVESNKKLVFDKDMIPMKIKDITIKEPIQIKDRLFDDCYILNNNTAKFNTPEYCLILESSSEENYLQVFTPEKRNIIAIEPKTGPSNSFNNKLGLSTLNPKETYKINWKIKLQNNE
ncbi:aldose 1-epimerase [Aquimarina sp. Aq78]|uniref:aldose 1-epimerase n=1 Tax=Aquimarina sp. Aq78 TaxID=1191889 RepID=UPI00131EA999|nr:aldose 1-epimerase [Aquimarina sp. Aq78]